MRTPREKDTWKTLPTKSLVIILRGLQRALANAREDRADELSNSIVRIKEELDNRYQKVGE